MRLVAIRLAGLTGRHRFILLSLTAHAALIAVLYYFGAYRIDLARQQQMVRAGAELSKLSGMDKRVRDMQQIKDLLQQSGGEHAWSDTAADQLHFSATSLPRPAAELLAEARQLSTSIAEVETRLRAEELARIEGISQTQALEQLDTPLPAPPQATPADAATPEQLTAEIARLEQRARTSLAQRQQQLQQRISGVPVRPPESTSGNSGGWHDNAQRIGANGEPANAGRARPGAGRDDDEMAKRIARFINRDLALPKDVSRSYERDGERIFNPGVGRIPPLDAAKVIRGVGRMLGRDGEFANRVYVNSWYLIGPFEGKHGSRLFSNYRYPPEDGVVLDAAYRGKDNRVVQWRYFNADSYPLVPPDFAEDAVYYGYTELMLDREQTLTVWIGADDDAQIWLNDERIWAGGNINKTSFWRDLYDTQNTYAHDFNMSEAKRRVHFKKGRNKLFFKLANGPSRTFFSLVLTK